MSTTFSLAYLENCAVALLDYAEAIGRPFHAGERREHSWLLQGFEDAYAECQTIDKRHLEYVTDLMVQLRSLLEPTSDRVRGGCFSRLTKRDIKHRIQLKTELEGGLSKLQRELQSLGVIHVKETPSRRTRQPMAISQPLFDLVDA